jgi:hypothetical protein
MTFLASTQTTAIYTSLDSGFPRSQQTPWTYEYGEDRTAVTYPAKVTEATQEPTMSHVYETRTYDSHWQYWMFTLKSSQDLPSSHEALQDLAKITSLWNEKDTSATFISEAQLQLLAGLYIFRNDTEVKHFLKEYPFLMQLLLETHSKIEAHFPHSQVFLEVATDYEAINRTSDTINSDKELVASISTNLHPEEAVEALIEFFDDWWLKALEEAKGKISFGLEFL